MNKKYFNLVKKNHSKLVQDKFEFDYIKQLKQMLKSSDKNVVKEAEEALEFLDAYLRAEFSGNIKDLIKLRNLNDELKKEINHAYNAHKRDFISNNKFLKNKDDISALIFITNLNNKYSDFYYFFKKLKKQFRKSGISIFTLKTKPQTSNIIINPVKIYSKEEVEKLNKERGYKS